MKFSNAILDEVRASRESIVKACNYDLDRLASTLRENERKSGRELVRLSPKVAIELPSLRKAS